MGIPGGPRGHFDGGDEGDDALDPALLEIAADLKAVLLVPPDPGVMAAHLAAMCEVSGLSVSLARASAPAPSAPWARRALAAGGVAAAVVFATAGLAAAGSLPPTVQNRVADLVSPLGLAFPRQVTQPAPVQVTTNDPSTVRPNPSVPAAGQVPEPTTPAGAVTTDAPVDPPTAPAVSRAPGQTGENPGQSDAPPPGQSGANPGKPGAEHPGQSGGAPGQTGANPGQSGAEPPGQTGANPGQPGDHGNPGDQEKAAQEKAAQEKAAQEKADQEKAAQEKAEKDAEDARRAEEARKAKEAEDLRIENEKNHTGENPSSDGQRNVVNGSGSANGSPGSSGQGD